MFLDCLFSSRFVVPQELIIKPSTTQTIKYLNKILLI